MTSSHPPDPAAFRILDANLNRAREALRVMEEYARFSLDDAALTARIKDLRHRLVGAIPVSIRSSLMQFRDTPGDVGCPIEGPSEYVRGVPGDVAAASASRLSEALRVIEEYGKLIDAGFARSIEQIRYQAYSIEKSLAWQSRPAGAFANVRVYVLMTEQLCRRDWFATAEAALAGGADCLQLREKGLPDVELIARARRLASLCRERRRLFIVNDRPDIAALCHADGVHVGQDDLSVADARRLLPRGAIVGKSTHTANQVRCAAAECPDYVAVGPMFDSATKPQPHVPGPALLTQAKELTSLPLVAIGGITPSNAADVVRAANCAICVCSAVIGAADSAKAVAELRRIVTGGQTSVG